jgi:nicotinamide-nucleotide amidase
VKEMKTAIITVGKEVLTGKTINTNLATISRKLNEIGIDVNRSIVIDDIKEEYYSILDFCDSDLIIFTGGLGPTIDDITRETVIDYFKVETYLDKNVLKDMEDYFNRIKMKMEDTNNKQAYFPKDSIILKNDLGTAPGVIFKAKTKTIVLFPGPPHEMIPMLEELIIYLKNELDIKLYSKGFRMVGIGESTMEKSLTGFYEKHPLVNVASYAGIGELKYVFTSSNEKSLLETMTDFKNKFNEYIYGDLGDTLEGVIVKQLAEKNMIISIAESCTGGLISSKIVNVNGSSKVFKESFVTYSNEAKIKHLGVKEETLNSLGAVSKEVAYEMAKGTANRTMADIVVSVTGIAGPTGGTPEKPIGLTYFGLSHNGHTETFKRIFNGNREMVRIRATVFALNLVRKELLK